MLPDLNCWCSPILVGLSFSGSIQLSCNIGAFFDIESSTFVVGCRTSYSMSINFNASSASCKLVAAIARIGWPLYKTLFSANIL